MKRRLERYTLLAIFALYLGFLGVYQPVPASPKTEVACSISQDFKDNKQALSQGKTTSILSEVQAESSSENWNKRSLFYKDTETAPELFLDLHKKQSNHYSGVFSLKFAKTDIAFPFSVFT